MLTHLALGVIIVAVFATAVANEDIKVSCGKDSVAITWRIQPELVPLAARFFLGSCMPSRLNVLPSGEGEAHFNYTFADCKFKRSMKGKRLLYRNELTFRPQPKSKPAAFVYPIECVYKRPEGWVPKFLNPGSSSTEGRGGLVFRMELLDETLSGLAKTNVVPLGSFMPVWAEVVQGAHQPLLLLMEECMAAATPELQADTQVLPIIGNKGCLLESKNGNSRFLPRYHASSLILYLQSFMLSPGKELYIHCKLVAWDPQALDQSRKACQYVKDEHRWELVDNPVHSSICGCCDSVCTSRYRRDAESESQGFSTMAVLGPLIITEPKDSNSQKAPEKSVTAADSELKI